MRWCVLGSKAVSASLAHTAVLRCRLTVGGRAWVVCVGLPRTLSHMRHTLARCRPTCTAIVSGKRPRAVTTNLSGPLHSTNNSWKRPKTQLCYHKEQRADSIWTYRVVPDTSQTDLVQLRPSYTYLNRQLLAPRAKGAPHCSDHVLSSHNSHTLSRGCTNQKQIYFPAHPTEETSGSSSLVAAGTGMSSTSSCLGSPEATSLSEVRQQLRARCGRRYVVQEVLGHGSYGVVCAATDAVSGDHVAIKRIANVFENTADARRILREIKLLRLLQHPGTCRCLACTVRGPGGSGGQGVKGTGRAAAAGTLGHCLSDCLRCGG